MKMHTKGAFEISGFSFDLVEISYYKAACETSGSGSGWILYVLGEKKQKRT